MKMHLPSFKWYFQRQFDANFEVWFHGMTVYVETANRFFTLAILQTIVVTAIMDALDAPLSAPDGPRQRSLLDAPIDTHLDAVQGALREHCNYIQKHTILGPDGERYEWRVDLRQVQQIIIETRRSQDVEMAKTLLQGELFMSDRLLEHHILHRVGVCFSNRRIREITKILVEEGILKNNGNLRTHGREVLL